MVGTPNGRCSPGFGIYTAARERSIDRLSVHASVRPTIAPFHTLRCPRRLIVSTRCASWPCTLVGKVRRLFGTPCCTELEAKVRRSLRLSCNAVCNSDAFWSARLIANLCLRHSCVLPTKVLPPGITGFIGTTTSATQRPAWLSRVPVGPTADHRWGFRVASGPRFSCMPSPLPGRTDGY